MSSWEPGDDDDSDDDVIAQQEENRLTLDYMTRRAQTSVDILSLMQGGEHKGKEQQVYDAALDYLLEWLT